jgi:hypothetical protein
MLRRTKWINAMPETPATRPMIPDSTIINQLPRSKNLKKIIGIPRAGRPERGHH